MDTIHERRLCVGECSNFRDIGGYLTADKKFRTRWNRLYRSDHLAKIGRTRENARILCDSLRVKHAIDFRGEAEKKAEPYHIDGVTVTEISVEPGNIMQTLLRMPEVREPAAVATMVELNELFVNQFKEQYRKFLKLVIEKGCECDDSAVLFHCTAGKDRTGYGAALILLLLGVDRETVFEDYLLTNTYFKPPPLDVLMNQMPSTQKMEKGALEALFYVRREYLQKALDTMDTQYGGVTNYVKTALGITDEELQKLRDAYLEPA